MSGNTAETAHFISADMYGVYHDYTVINEEHKWIKIDTSQFQGLYTKLYIDIKSSVFSVYGVQGYDSELMPIGGTSFGSDTVFEVNLSPISKERRYPYIYLDIRSTISSYDLQVKVTSDIPAGYGGTYDTAHEIQPNQQYSLDFMTDQQYHYIKVDTSQYTVGEYQDIQFNAITNNVYRLQLRNNSGSVLRWINTGNTGENVETILTYKTEITSAMHPYFYLTLYVYPINVDDINNPQITTQQARLDIAPIQVESVTVFRTTDNGYPVFKKLNSTGNIGYYLTPWQATDQRVTFTAETAGILDIDENGNYTAIGMGRTRVWVTPVDQSQAQGEPIRDYIDIDVGIPPVNQEIYTAEDLYNVRYDLTLNYIQMANIDLSVYPEWTPIANDNVFSGNFDGNGFEISNLNISNADYRNLGLFGRVGENGVLKNINLVSGEILGDSSVGALIGYMELGTVEKCKSNVNVDGTYAVGGLIGETYVDEGSLIIRNSSYKGNVGNSDGYAVGGLVGYLDGHNSNVEISQCFATGDVIGDYSVGGLIGEIYSYYGFIRDCYATGDVTGGGAIGGLVGGVYDDELGFVIENLYATGTVTGEYDVGGLVGYSDYTNYVSSYYDSETSGQVDVGKGEPRTTVQMKTQVNFVGWDFENVWHIKEGQAYPTFKSTGFTPNCVAIPLSSIIVVKPSTT